jgi:hypothetical protein
MILEDYFAGAFFAVRQSVAEPKLKDPRTLKKNYFLLLLLLLWKA